MIGVAAGMGTLISRDAFPLSLRARESVRLRGFRPIVSLIFTPSRQFLPLLMSNFCHC